jgi:DNA repair protein RadC
MSNIKHMFPHDLPRERLLKEGVKALRTDELIALLLHTGSEKHHVLALAEQVLTYVTHLHDLKSLKVQELMTIEGIKVAKATTIIAAIELGRRLSSLSIPELYQIKTSLDVYQLVQPELSHLEQEHVMGLYLNTKGFVVLKESIFVGSINETMIHPREMFKHAIKVGAASVIFCHNHPTGDARPSPADLRITQDLMTIGMLLKIEVLDHVIIGQKQYHSIKEKKTFYMP